MSQPTVDAFFAYPANPPALAETIRSAIERINSPNVRITSWEQARIGGKAIIGEICNLINKSALILADVTGTNPNVMFELGYAVARNKRIWLVLDTSRAAAKRDYDQLRLLTGIGYRPYVNSRDIINGFYQDHPFDDLTQTVLETLIKPLLTPGLPAAGCLYLKSRHETDADRKVSEAVVRYSRNGLSYTIDDPNEARVQPLSWYAEKVYSSLGVLAHLSSESRDGARAHNARQAFVCGLAYGMDKRLLLLAEEDYSAPLDYQDLLLHYTTAKECAVHAEAFLDKTLLAYRNSGQNRPKPFDTLQLATELKALRIGDYVAEHEAPRLSEYFVETLNIKQLCRIGTRFSSDEKVLERLPISSA